jgi:hypothetical protein
MASGVTESIASPIWRFFSSPARTPLSSAAAMFVPKGPSRSRFDPPNRTWQWSSRPYPLPAWIIENLCHSFSDFFGHVHRETPSMVSPAGCSDGLPSQLQRSLRRAISGRGPRRSAKLASGASAHAWLGIPALSFTSPDGHCRPALHRSQHVLLTPRRQQVRRQAALRVGI